MQNSYIHFSKIIIVEDIKFILYPKIKIIRNNICTTECCSLVLTVMASSCTLGSALSAKYTHIL